MSPEPDHEITRLLRRAREGNQAAIDELLNATIREMRKIAGRLMRGEREDHSLQPTALVNEVYLKLFQNAQLTLQDRKHFFAMVTVSMRQLLIDHARERNALKRGNRRQRVELEDVRAISAAKPIDWLDLDRALERLNQINPERYRVVELHFFQGLTFAEVALKEGCSEKTVKRRWDEARKWLQMEMGEYTYPPDSEERDSNHPRQERKGNGR